MKEIVHVLTLILHDAHLFEHVSLYERLLFCLKNPHSDFAVLRMECLAEAHLGMMNHMGIDLIAIVGAVFLIAACLFSIWVIHVAKKAIDEITEGQ